MIKKDVVAVGRRDHPDIAMHIDAIIDMPANIERDFMSDVRRLPFLWDRLSWYARITSIVARHTARMVGHDDASGDVPTTDDDDLALCSVLLPRMFDIAMHACIAIANGTTQTDVRTNGRMSLPPPPPPPPTQSNEFIALLVGPLTEESATRIRGGDATANADGMPSSIATRSICDEGGGREDERRGRFDERNLEGK